MLSQELFIIPEEFGSSADNSRIVNELHYSIQDFQLHLVGKQPECCCNDIRLIFSEKLIDPLADKILVSAAFIYLTAVGVCPLWVSILIIFREFLVTGLRQLAVERGFVMAADKSGKWKTGMQLGYCIACMVHLAYAGNLPEPLHSLSIGILGEWLRGIFLWSSVLLTLWSGIHYCISSRSFLRD
jgi:CDP-diacylglycerol--glycerol-3-phosphate 3-phosphatidyltransferase